MTAFTVDMTIPIGDAGHVHLHINITNPDALTPDQRRVLADTGGEFYEFAAATLNPPTPAAAAAVHDPNGAVLAGVTGSRIRDKL
jgi:hypothetical protein